MDQIPALTVLVGQCQAADAATFKRADLTEGLNSFQQSPDISLEVG